jgi:hypothetical protein
MSYKVFANGSPLQASELNLNLMQQAIAVFTDATARDAAITAPLNGQFAYLTGTSNLTKYTGAAWEDAISIPDTGTTVSEQATSRAIVSGDANSFIYATAAITITVDDVLAVGETINFIQNVDAAPITFAAGAGVTLNSKEAALLTGGQFAGASLTKKATNSYYLVGDLA